MRSPAAGGGAHERRASTCSSATSRSAWRRVCNSAKVSGRRSGSRHVGQAVGSTAETGRVSRQAGQRVVSAYVIMCSLSTARHPSGRRSVLTALSTRAQVRLPERYGDRWVGSRIG